MPERYSDSNGEERRVAVDAQTPSSEPPRLHIVSDGPLITAEVVDDELPLLRAPYEWDAASAGPQTHTPADRDRIMAMLTSEQARLQRRPAWEYGPDPGAIAFRRALHAEGAVAASILFDAVSDPDSPIAAQDAVGYVEVCATQENTAGLVSLLHQAKDRMLPVLPLVRTLQRVADVSAIPDLLRYIRNAPDQEYENLEARAYRVLRIAVAAEQRHPAGSTDRDRWGAVARRIAAMRRGDGSLLFKDTTVAHARRETEPGQLALTHALRRHGDHPNKSLNYHPADGQPAADLGRLTTLRNLYHISEARGARVQRNTDEHVLTRLVAREQSCRYGVSIGTEVEIEELAMTVGAAGKDIVPVVEARVDNLNYVAGAGVPRVEESSAGIFTEFALVPSRHYATTARELGQMAALDVISPEFTEHPLHATVGYITTTGPRGSGAFILARSLEATGWSCSGDRLRQPLQQPGSWAHRGYAGLSERLPKKIEGDAGTAVEFRTFSLQSIPGAVRTLRSLYALGSALRAYQKELAHELDETERQLAGAWREYQAEVESIFRRYGVGYPSALWRASDGDNGMGSLDRSFHRLAILLDEAKAGIPRGVAFQDEMQRHVIRRRGQVMTILERAETHA